MKTRTQLTTCQELAKHAIQMKKTHMNELFSADNQRFEKLSVQLPSMLLGYSKNIITEKNISNLIALAHECKIESRREKMFSGKRIYSERLANSTPIF